MWGGGRQTQGANSGNGSRCALGSPKGMGQYPQERCWEAAELFPSNALVGEQEYPRGSGTT